FLTNARINRADYARMLLLGRLPVHYSKINMLRTLVMRRYAHLLSVVRKGSHNKQMIEAAFGIIAETVRTAQDPPTIQLHTHARPDVDREFELELDRANSSATILHDAVRIDLLMTVGSTERPNFRHSASIILGSDGWQIA